MKNRNLVAESVTVSSVRGRKLTPIRYDVYIKVAVRDDRRYYG
jgi:hypothetical protein